MSLSSLLLVFALFPQQPEVSQETVTAELEALIERTASASTIHYDLSFDIQLREEPIPPFQLSLTHAVPDRYAFSVSRPAELGEPFALSIWADQQGAAFQAAGLPVDRHGRLAWADLKPWAAEAEAWRATLEEILKVDPVAALDQAGAKDDEQGGADEARRGVLTIRPTLDVREEGRFTMGVSGNRSKKPQSLCFWLYTLMPVDAWEVRAAGDEFRFSGNRVQFIIDRETGFLEALDVTREGETLRFIELKEGWIDRKLPEGAFEPTEPPEASVDRSEWLLHVRDLGRFVLARQRWYAHFLQERLEAEQSAEDFADRARERFEALYADGISKALDVGLLPALAELGTAYAEAAGPGMSTETQAALSEAGERFAEESQPMLRLMSMGLRQQWALIQSMAGERSPEMTAAIEAIPAELESEILALEQAGIQAALRKYLSDAVERYRAENPEEF